VLMVGILAVFFDTTIVSVALRTLTTSLHTSVSTIQWVSTGYLLALGVTVPLAAWGQARFGGKRLWLFALVVFLAGSIGSSLAPGVGALIAARALQGVGGGIMLPLLQTLIIQGSGAKPTGRTVALISLPIVLGPILGPVIGGAILHWFDWRWLFWVNVPFCVVGFVLAWRLLPADGRLTKARLDIVGLLLLAPGIVGVLLGLSNVSGANGFGAAKVLWPLLAGAALLVAFAVYGVRAAGKALVEVRLLRRRPLASSSMVMFLSGVCLYGAMLLLPLYWQEVRGASALTAGLMLVPQGLGTLLSRTLSGRLTDSVGARWVAFVGFVVVGLATVPFAVASADTSKWLLMGALVVRGAGLGAVMIPMMTVSLIGLDRDELPHASVITRIAQQVGGSFGTATLAVILERSISSTSLVDAFHHAFWWTVGFTGVAVLLCLVLPTGMAEQDSADPAAAVAVETAEEATTAAG
jgi:EmrB/QacA subfamily drug resistance transporter